MAYVTQAMLEDRIGSAELVRLTDDSGAGSVDADNLTRAITEGEADILAYLGQKYEMPLTLTNATTATVVRTKLLDCVEWRLHGRRQPVPADIDANRKLAMAWAQAIAAGKIGLPGETPLGESPADAGRIVIDATARVVDRDSTKGL